MGAVQASQYSYFVFYSQTNHSVVFSVDASAGDVVLCVNTGSGNTSIVLPTVSNADWETPSAFGTARINVANTE